MNQLPFEIIDAMIQCFGRSFHYKDIVEIFLVTAGVNRNLAKKYRDEPKFVWARKLLSELNETEDGQIIQRRILTELCKLRNVPDRDVPDPDAGLSALRKLKTIAYEHDLIVKESKKERDGRISIRREKLKIVEDRAKKLENLHNKFLESVKSPDRQEAGYSLEDLIKELFAIFEIEYRKSYKIAAQQIDGHFKFEGFDYLVEARWRKDQPNEKEVGWFKRKVDTKLESTRGIFVSINGFRDEVINKFTGIGSNLIFMSGEDLIFILEGRIDLRDALRFKIEKASQEGQVYISLPRIILKK